ncbi:MAG: flavodoxin family protein [Candidatus Thorarchaeota archaeon]|jgi:flavorubredoxin
MKTAIIVCESVYGNTLKIAEAICQGINAVEGVDCVVKKTGEIHTDELRNYDAILFGGPNHDQAPALNITRFITRAMIVHLKEKIGAVFDTYTGGNKDVAVAKLEKKVQDQIPGITLVGRFSAKVAGRKGPLVDGEEARALAFGSEFGQKL